MIATTAAAMIVFLATKMVLEIVMCGFSDRSGDAA
jgi:hypothetical protein